MQTREPIRIPEGNEFSLCLPLVLLTEDGREPLPASHLQDIHVRTSWNSVSEEREFTTDGNKIIVAFGETLPLGCYNVHIYAQYQGRCIASHMRAVFEIVRWNDLANFEDYVFEKSQTAPTSVFIQGGEESGGAERPTIKLRFENAFSEQYSTLSYDDVDDDDNPTGSLLVRGDKIFVRLDNMPDTIEDNYYIVISRWNYKKKAISMFINPIVYPVRVRERIEAMGEEWCNGRYIELPYSLADIVLFYIHGSDDTGAIPKDIAKNIYRAIFYGSQATKMKFGSTLKQYSKRFFVQLVKGELVLVDGNGGFKNVSYRSEPVPFLARVKAGGSGKWYGQVIEEYGLNGGDPVLSFRASQTEHSFISAKT